MRDSRRLAPSPPPPPPPPPSFPPPPPRGGAAPPAPPGGGGGGVGGGGAERKLRAFQGHSHLSIDALHRPEARHLDGFVAQLDPVRPEGRQSVFHPVVVVALRIILARVRPAALVAHQG